MSRLALSPSLLDSYAWWRGGEQDEDGERKALEEMIAKVKREPTRATPAMQLGTAWHSAVEREPEDGVDEVGVTLGGGASYRFDAQSIRYVRAQFPAGTLREVEARLDLPEAGIVLDMRADALSGNEVHEVKSTEKDFDPDKYMGSWQWRAYLLGFDAAVIVYHVCRLEFDEEAEVYRLRDHARMTQYPYPGMRSELVDAAREVATLIRDQGLESYRLEREAA